MKTVICFLSLLGLGAAHFKLDYPPARGFVEQNLPQFPCGGQNSVSPNRTEWPIAGGAIQLEMEHDRVMLQVLLGVGNDVGDGFNVTMLPTIQQEGEGQFCLSKVNVPSGMDIKDGTNATIQVVTNGDPNGGLYNCADITFRTSAPPPTQCKNGTGVTTMPNSGQFKNANQTNPGGAAGSSASQAPSGTSSGTAGAAAATTKANAAATMALMGRSVEWSVGGVVLGAVGFALLL